jgi:cysteinyl-tRNA synthetase, unknown class
MLAFDSVSVWQRLLALLLGAPPDLANHRRTRRPSGQTLKRSSRPFESDKGFSHESLTDRGPLLKARSWACQLQGVNGGEIDIDHIKTSDADAVIIDYARDGSEARAFTSADVAAMKLRRSGTPKQVIAYMSIGEAEEARFYWKKVWAHKANKTPAAPSWLYKPNEGGWSGNWRVKFWNADWQKIIIDDPRSFLNQIIDAGFDGVFLDIVEAAEYWEDDARGHDRRSNASKDMIAFVQRIASHARLARGKPGFLVIPNGDFLLESAAYRATISALMREDVLYKQTSQADEAPAIAPRPHEGEDGVAAIAARLNMAAPDNLPVLAIEYLMDRPQDQERVAEVADALRHLAPNVLPYFSVRNLDRLCGPFEKQEVA